MNYNCVFYAMEDIRYKKILFTSLKNGQASVTMSHLRKLVIVKLVKNPLIALLFWATLQ